jgi:eukaryotic-like serine/threonine-protein kinase
VDKPEQWGRIKEIVGAALERVPSERPAFLNEVCGADESVRAEVESLLSAYEKADGLSESALTQTFSDVAQVSKSLGPYRLVQKLGEGGMGQVWLAEQTSPVQRKVALKLVKPGMYDDSVLRRFQSERQSLAIMDHPVIAKVFDAGATPDGHPYFVMEYVPGVAITDYCDQKKLKIRARLELFLRVCEGVQHAHQKAIIHRDLKPANILVVEVDGKPVPRIIDFGLAKPVTPYLSGETMNTKIGGLVGTPGYMSPEQADPGVEDVDTRTDVYSLGVMLYELLTGFQPFDAEGLKKLRLEEVLRQLREEDPPRPSTKVSAERDTSSSRAEARGTEPRQLSSLLRGDLDWIAMKALEKERSRRYGTPSELAADISRYLNNEPVAARPASAGYRLRKYVRRNRAGVAVGVGLAILLVTFAVTQAVQLQRITRERDRANRIAAFMTSMFKVSDPSEARGNSITAREILDKSSKEIETGLAQDPVLRAQMTTVMGEVYLNLGLYPKAESLLEQAGQIRRQILGIRNRDTLDSLDKLAWVYQEESKYEQSEQIEREILPIRRQLFGAEDRDTLGSQMNLANAVFGQGRYAESERIDREALAIRRRVLPEDRMTLIEISNLAITVSQIGHYSESDQLLNEAIGILNRTVGPEDPFTIKARSNLADNYDKEGRFAEAERMTRELLEIRRRVLGPDHPDTLTNGGDVGTILYQEKRFAEAEKIHRETLELQKRITGPEHFQTLITMSNLSDDLAALRRYPEAEQLSRQAWGIQQRVFGPEHSNTLLSAVSLAAVYRKEGRYTEAERLTRTALASQRKLFGDSHADCAFSEYNLALIAAAQGNRDVAFSILRSALAHELSPDVAGDLEKDPDLISLHSDPRFDALVAVARNQVASAKAQ